MISKVPGLTKFKTNKTAKISSPTLKSLDLFSVSKNTLVSLRIAFVRQICLQNMMNTYKLVLKILFIQLQIKGDTKNE